MGRFGKMFEELGKRREGAFIPFVVLGDPGVRVSEKILDVLSRHADALELGLPFSDPIADGKRIQLADQRALKAGANTDKCFSVLRGLREKNNRIPIGLLVYYNLVLRYGPERFLRKAKKSGADAVLVADLPVEEAQGFRKLCRKNGLDEAFIVAPTTGKERMKKIIGAARGFVYAVSVLGVTGERSNVLESTALLVKKIKKISGIPVCVGFGVSKPGHARKIISMGADGVIVGSAVEAVIENNLGNTEKMLKKIAEFAFAMKRAAKK